MTSDLIVGGLEILKRKKSRGGILFDSISKSTYCVALIQKLLFLWLVVEYFGCLCSCFDIGPSCDRGKEGGNGRKSHEMSLVTWMYPLACHVLPRYWQRRMATKQSSVLKLLFISSSSFFFLSFFFGLCHSQTPAITSVWYLLVSLVDTDSLRLLCCWS